MDRSRTNGTKPGNGARSRGGALHALLGALVEPALLVRAGTSEIEVINDEAAKLFGYTPQELVGQPIEVLIPERLRQAHLVYGRSRIGARTRRMAENRQLTALRRDGTEFPVEITLSPVRWRGGEFLAAVVRDVTASRLTTGVLASTEERLKTIVSAMSEPIVMLYDDGSVEACNQAAMDFGSSERTAPGMPEGWRFLAEDGTPLDGPDVPGRKSIATGSAFQGTIVGLQRPKQPLAWFSVNSQPLFEPDTAAPYAAVLTFTDVTERRRASVALRASEEYLRQRTRELERANSQLEISSAQLAEAHAQTVLMLAAASEAHDRATGLHIRSVRALSESLARELGYAENDAEEIGLAAILHDIGKIRVPDSILTRASALGRDQWEIMKQHTTWGMEFLLVHDRFMLAAQVARSHHERWDGTGYPDGLAGDVIPEEVAIVTVADSFDAMVSQRPYREPWPIERALAEVAACAGSQFSPRVAEALLRLHAKGLLPQLHPQAGPMARAA
jgi:putative two-component system response regulator